MRNDRIFQWIFLSSGVKLAHQSDHSDQLVINLSSSGIWSTTSEFQFDFIRLGSRSIVEKATCNDFTKWKRVFTNIDFEQYSSFIDVSSNIFFSCSSALNPSQWSMSFNSALQSFRLAFGSLFARCWIFSISEKCFGCNSTSRLSIGLARRTDQL